MLRASSYKIKMEVHSFRYNVWLCMELVPCRSVERAHQKGYIQPQYHLKVAVWWGRGAHAKCTVSTSQCVLFSLLRQTHVSCSCRPSSMGYSVHLTAQHLECLDIAMVSPSYWHCPPLLHVQWITPPVGMLDKVCSTTYLCPGLDKKH